MTTPNPIDVFWLVARDVPAIRAERRHDTLEDARQEAERLAKKENDRFLVFQVIAAVQPACQVDWTELGAP